MWNLDPRKYSSVYLKKHAITPWIVPSENISELCAVAGLIRDMMSDYKNFHEMWSVSWAQEHFRKPSPSPAPEEMLTFLGLQAVHFTGSTFLSKEDFDQRERSADLVLPSEKFFSKPFISMGSSRHALAGNFQLKGIGRNSLCLDEDYYHSWGGWIFRDALKAFVADRLATGKSELGSLKLLGMFLYKDVPKGFPPLVLGIREADSYRLCQLEESFITKNEISTVQEFLEKRFPGLRPQEILASIFRNYLNAFLRGVIHRSPNKDNLLIDGRWIDSESLDCTLGDRPMYPFFRVFVKDKISFGEGFQKQLKELQLKNVHFYDSWVHHLRLMCELTYDTYKTLYGDVFGGFASLYEKALTSSFLQKDVDFWKPSLSFLSQNEMTFSRSQETELSLISDYHRYEEALGDFRCISLHYDSVLKGTVLNFASADEDIHFTMNKVIKKLEASFWPSELTLPEAMKNAETISQAVKGLIS